MMNGIGDRLKELRKKNGLTQERVAESLGVSYQAVSKWENGAASPDLSLIVPLARLFQISTDELLGYTTDHRAELRMQYFQAQLALERIKICEAVLKEYPNDREFLHRLAGAEYECADETMDKVEQIEYLERSVRHFKTLVEEYPSENPCGTLVQALTKLGRYDDALSYVQSLPKWQGDKVLEYCLTGEELFKHRQEMTDRALQTFIGNMIHYESYANLQTAEDIINLVFSDGNYHYYYNSLATINFTRARLLVAENRYGEAVEALRQMLQYCQQHKRLRGKLPFMSPIFDKLVYDTSTETGRHRLGQSLLKNNDFDVLRDREDFIALTKQV